MSSPTSWMPFWLAATWARRSDRLSCRFRVPLQPVILPGARRASVTAGWMESPLSYPPSPEAALPYSTPAAPPWDTVGPHIDPSLAPHTLLTPSVPPEPPASCHLLKFLLLPQAHPHTDTPGWGRQQEGRGAVSLGKHSSLLRLFLASLPTTWTPLPPALSGPLPSLPREKPPTFLDPSHSHSPQPRGPHLPPHLTTKVTVCVAPQQICTRPPAPGKQCCSWSQGPGPTSGKPCSCLATGSSVTCLYMSIPWSLPLPSPHMDQGSSQTHITLIVSLAPTAVCGSVMPPSTLCTSPPLTLGCPLGS